MQTDVSVWPDLAQALHSTLSMHRKFPLERRAGRSPDGKSSPNLASLKMTSRDRVLMREREPDWRRLMLIFTVDDERVIASTLAVILRQAMYEAQAYFDAASALAAAKQLPPDLLITDINMPVTDGCELAAEMSLLYPSCRILFFSGNDRYDPVMDARHSAKGWSLLRKPVRPADLLQKVATILGKASHEDDSKLISETEIERMNTFNKSSDNVGQFDWIGAVNADAPPRLPAAN